MKREMKKLETIRVENLDKPISVQGIVVGDCGVEPRIKTITWECPECGEEIETESDLESISRPVQCSCMNRRGFRAKGKTACSP